MSSKYKKLLEIADKLTKENVGVWTSPHGEGTIDEPLVLGRPVYSNLVRDFVETVYEVEKQCPELELRKYTKVLEDNKILDVNELTDEDISKLNLQCVMAVIFWIVRGERFCDGLIMNKIEDGSVKKLLKRLKEIINAEN